MAFGEFNLDDTVIHTDCTAVGKSEVIGACRQPDIIEDQVQIRSRDLFADIVLDRLEYLFGALNAGAGGGTDMQLNEARIDARKEIGPDEEEQDAPADHDQTRHRRGQNPPPQNACKQPAIEIAETIEPCIETAWKRDSQPVSMSRRSCSLRNSRPIMMGVSVREMP